MASPLGTSEPTHSGCCGEFSRGWISAAFAPSAGHLYLVPNMHLTSEAAPQEQP